MSEPTPLPLLLRAQPHLTVAPATCMDFQARVGRPSAPGVGDVTSCVLILSRAVDREMDELSLWLASQGIALLRVDSDRCAEVDLRWDPAAGVLDWDGRRFRPKVCWRRYFDAEALAVSADDDAVVHYVRDQWLACAAALMGADTSRSINPNARPGLPDRITQLAAARAVGLRTPATTVTSRLAGALDAIPGTGDLVVKSLGRHSVEAVPGQLRGVFPERVTRERLAAESGVEAAPVLVQEFIPTDRELRIYAIGEQLIGYTVTRPTPAALWTTPSAIKVEPCQIAPALQTALRRLTAHFTLDIAAFDLLDATGGPVFLEVNPECDWLWAERAAGTTATSAAVRDLVVELFSRDHTGDDDA